MYKILSILSLFLAAFTLTPTAANAEWSAGDRQGYDARCVESMKQMGPENAQKFCSCARQELEGIYDSPQAMGQKIQADPKAEQARFGPLVMQCARKYSSPPPQQQQN